MTAPRHERNTAIFRQRAAGASYGQIAKQYQITRQRAQAIVEAMRDKEFMNGGRQ
jgi:Mor family transcriptional regulator